MEVALKIIVDCCNEPYIITGWANLFNGRVIGRKTKTPASRKISLQCHIQFVKECKFRIK